MLGGNRVLLLLKYLWLFQLQILIILDTTLVCFRKDDGGTLEK